MEDSNGRKALYAIKSRTIRELVLKANELKVQKGDTVAVLQENGQYVLLYYYPESHE